MARGGSRPGAGRRTGTINKMTQEARKAAAKTGELPVDYMLRVMRDEETETKRRDAMAIAAAPYLHPKLAATEVTGPGGGPVQIQKVERVIVDPKKPDGADAQD